MSSKPLHLLVSDEIFNDLESLAKRSGLPKSQLVRQALKDYIKSTKASGGDPSIDLSDITFEEE